MTGKDLLARFRAAPWRTEEDVDGFVETVGDLGVEDVRKLLDIATSGGGTSEQQILRGAAFRRLAERVPDRTLFRPYVEALPAAPPSLRSVLAQLIPTVNSVSDHPILAGLLRSRDAALRSDVAGILAAVGRRSVVGLLESMASEASFPGRMEAMSAVVLISPQHAVPVMRAVITIGAEAEKVKAISYLTEPRCMARDPGEALAAMTGALGDDHDTVVASAIAGVAALGSDDDYFGHVGPYFESKNLTIARAAVEGLRLFTSSRAVAALRLRLRVGPRVLRFAAIDALEAIGSADVLEPLVDALGHAQVAVRTRAAAALLGLGEAGKVDLARTVVWLLRSRDINVRRMAVELVQTVKDPDGDLWPKLLGYLRDEDWWVRERVMDALAEIAGERLLPHLAGFLQDPSDVIRRFGVDALLRLRAPASLGTLLRTAASDPDWWVRERAIEAAAAIRDPRAAPHLVDLMLKNAQLQVACLTALADLGAGTAASDVVSLLRSEDGDVRLAALRCLRAIGHAGLSPAVEAVLRDPRPEIRALAREIIFRWGAGSEEIAGAEPASLLDELLLALARAQGDDLILGPGRRPLVKRLGGTQPVSDDPISAERLKALLAPHLSLQQLEALEAGIEVDFSYRMDAADLRFRVNVFKQFGGIGAVFRIIKSTLPALEQLGLPLVVTRLGGLLSGLVLVGGATGSGKSTTLAALIDQINRTSRRHVMTFEDPIEVVHPRAMGLVNQREVGTHTGPLHAALRSTLRQDPDVILVGELRDLATISFAVSAAETGHLVFGTIHTVSSAGCVDRLVNVFPGNQQDHVRSIVAGSLKAVICQHLVPRADGSGSNLAVEVMLNNEAIANLIRQGKTFQIPSVIATSREQGMQLMDTELLRLAREGRISPAEAYARAVSKKDFEPLLVAGIAGPTSPVEVS